MVAPDVIQSHNGPMAQHDHLDPSPFVLIGGNVGVLMVHGFSGSPTEMRLLADALHQGGCTVHGALVAGHGRTFEEFETVQWQQWVQSVRDAYAALEPTVDRIYLVGQSTGAVLLQHLINEPKVCGVVAIAPAFWVRTLLMPHSSWWKYIQRRLKKGIEDIVDQEALSLVWSYDELPTRAVHELYRLQRSTRPLLRQSKHPLLILQGRRDKTVHRMSAQRMFDLAQTEDRGLIYLDGTGHLATVDREREQLVSHVREWLEQREAQRASTPTAMPASQLVVRPVPSVSVEGIAEDELHLKD